MGGTSRDDSYDQMAAMSRRCPRTHMEQYGMKVFFIFRSLLLSKEESLC
jgi:hypothetical protein